MKKVILACSLMMASSAFAMSGAGHAVSVGHVAMSPAPVAHTAPATTAHPTPVAAKLSAGVAKPAVVAKPAPASEVEKPTMPLLPPTTPYAGARCDGKDSKCQK